MFDFFGFILKICVLFLGKIANTTANAIRRAATTLITTANAIAATTAMTAMMTATMTMAMMAAMIAMTTATANAQFFVNGVQPIAAAGSTTAPTSTRVDAGATIAWRITFNADVNTGAGDVDATDLRLFRLPGTGSACTDVATMLGTTGSTEVDSVNRVDARTFDITATIPATNISGSPYAENECIILSYSLNPGGMGNRFISNITSGGGNSALTVRATTGDTSGAGRYLRVGSGAPTFAAVPFGNVYTLNAPPAGATRIDNTDIPSNTAYMLYQMSRTTAADNDADPGGTGVAAGDTIRWRIRFTAPLDQTGGHGAPVADDFAVYRLSAADCTDTTAGVGDIVAGTTITEDLTAGITPAGTHYDIAAELPDPVPSATAGDCFRLGYASTSVILGDAGGTDIIVDGSGGTLSTGTNARRVHLRTGTGAANSEVFTESDQFYTFGTPSGPTTPPTTLPALTGTVTSDATAVTATFAADADITNPATTIVAGDFAVTVGGTAFSGTVNVGSPAARSFTLTFDHGLTPQDAGNARDIEISLTTQGETKYTLASALTHTVAATAPRVTSFDIMGTGNDFTVVFSKPVGGVEADNFVITDFNDATDTEMVASTTAVSPTNGRSTNWTVTISGADTGYVLVAFSNDFRDIVDEDGLSLASRPTDTAVRGVNVSSVDRSFIRRALASDPDAARTDPTMRSYTPTTGRDGSAQDMSAGYVEELVWTVTYASPVPTGTSANVGGVRLSVEFDYQVACSNAESTTDRNMAVAMADEVACGSANISSDTSSNMMHVVTARGLRTSNFINYTLTTGMGNTVSAMGVTATTSNAVAHLDTRAPRLIGFTETTAAVPPATTSTFTAYFDQTVTGLDGQGMVPDPMNPGMMTTALANFRLDGNPVAATGAGITVSTSAATCPSDAPSGSVTCWEVTVDSAVAMGSLSLVTSYDGMGARDAAGNPIQGISRTLIQAVQTAVTSQLQSVAQSYIANTPVLVNRVSRISSPSPVRGGGTTRTTGTGTIGTGGTTGTGTTGTGTGTGGTTGDSLTDDNTTNFAFAADNDHMRFGYENDSRTQSFTYSSTDINTDIEYNGVFALSDFVSIFSPMGLEFWTQATYSATDNSITDAESDTFFIHAGLDREFRQNVIGGIMFQYDASDSSTPGTTSSGLAEVSSSGWMVGPYLAAQAVRYTLSFESRVAYGESTSDIMVTGAGETSYDSSRLAASAAMSGVIGSLRVMGSSWDINPRFQYDYFTTESDEHMLGTQAISSSEYTLNRLTFGPSFSSIYDWNGNVLTPSVSFSGLLNQTSVTEGVELGDDTLTGRLDASVGFDAIGLDMNAGFYYEGIGSDITSYGITGGLRLDF